MKLAYVSATYAGALVAFDAEHPGLGSQPFAVQREAFEREAFGWAGAWGPALQPLGWEVREVWTNVASMQRAWASEHGLPPSAAPEDIAAAQVIDFRPDVLWFDHHDDALLARLRPGVRAAVGWTGSAVSDSPRWRAFDAVLSCAPESVEALARGGARSEYLPHAFNERVLERLESRPPRIGVSFVGQLAGDHPLHVHRERILDETLRTVDVAIFGEASARRSAAGALARRGAWHVARSLARAGLDVRRVPGIGRAAAWPAPPRGPLPRRLARALRPPCYGLRMYQTLRDSRVTLNIHAGSATRFSSNMRLFEATGVGTCLLTDHAANLGELFDAGREVVTFRDGGEMVERARWLLDHEDERAGIARAGQSRCLEAHTFARRAPQLDAVLRSVVRAC